MHEEITEPEPAPSPPAPARLRRRAHGRVIAGVAGGLADRSGLPAGVVRAAFGLAAAVCALIAIATVVDPYGRLYPLGLPPGIVVLSFAMVGAYVLLWWVVPREDLARSAAGRLFSRYRVRALLARYPRIRTWPGLALLALGGALLADQLGIWSPNVALALASIALGVWLYRSDGDVSVAAASPDERQSLTTSTAVAQDDAPPARDVDAHPHERASRERSPLGWIVFGAALLVGCLAAIWATTVSPSVDAAGSATGLSRVSAAPALALLVLAAGLLIGSVYGRSRWLILPALLVVPPMLLASAIPMPLRGGYGDVYARPRAAGELAGAYRQSVGSVFVDLDALQGHDELRARPLSVSTAVGTITIVVPFDASYGIDARSGLGTVSFARRWSDGPQTALSGEITSKYDGGPRFVFDLRTGIGNINVLRQAPTREQLRALEREERKSARSDR